MDIKTDLFRKALSSADFLVNLFDAAKSDVVRQLPDTEKRFVSIPNSINGEKFFIQEKNQNLLERNGILGKKIVFTICRLSKSERDNKGYAKVVEAMPLVLREIPDAMYLLAGGGDDIDYVKGLVNELGIQDSVVLPGRIPDEEMLDYYNLADVFVYVSKREGFPAIVFLEALACGRPVIAGDQKDSKGFDEKFGLVVNPDEKKEIADAIIKILKRDVDEKLITPLVLRKAVIDEYGKETYMRHIKNFIALVSNSEK